jgi:alpha,alpha-trehalose phosphorylase
MAVGGEGLRPFLPQAETIFAVANGYLGMRGVFEEGEPAYRHGTFVNGFHETWPIPYGERAFGFATTGQTMVNLPDGKLIRLYVDDEPFELASARILRFERALDMCAGTLDRQVLWETSAGRRLLIESRRLVSFHEKHVAAIYYRVTVLNARAALVLVSELVNHVPAPEAGEDDQPAGPQFVGSRACSPTNRRGRPPGPAELPDEEQRDGIGVWNGSYA